MRRRNSAPQPTKVMHEDDPLFKKRKWLTWLLNRRNLSIAAALMAAITVTGIVVEVYRIESYLGERKQVRDKENRDRRNEIGRVDEQVNDRVNMAICYIVQNHPDSDGQDFADLRDLGNCPPYNAKNRRAPSARPTVSPSATPRALPSSTGPRPGAIGAPSPSQSASRTPGAAPSATVTQRNAAGRPTATRTVRATATRTVTVRPANPSPKPLLCSPLGLPIAVGCPSR